MLSDPAMSSEASYGLYRDIRYAGIHRDIYIYIYIYGIPGVQFCGLFFNLVAG